VDLFRRRRQHPDLDDAHALILGEDEPTAAERRDAELAVLRRIAAEAVILQDAAEALLLDIRAREPLAQLAPRGGRLTSRFVALAQTLPASVDPEIQRYSRRLREVLDHHALMLCSSLDLLAVAWRSERLEEEVDRIAGLGRPAAWLEDIRMALMLEPPACVQDALPQSSLRT
jgi:hypothetical protein